MRKSVDELLLDLNEGVYDPNIFKAIFLAGGPGSGKSYIAGRTIRGGGLRIVNSDSALEALLKKANLSLKMPDSQAAQRDPIRDKAKTFFIKKADQDANKKKEFNSYRFESHKELSLEDCEEQLKDWARELVDREIRRRPEGQKLNQLEKLKQHSIDTVMEAGTPEELIKSLDNTTKKIGIAWVVDTSKIQQISQ